jgi:hypothetical protein
MDKDDIRRVLRRALDIYDARLRQARDAMENAPDVVQKAQWYAVMTHWSSAWNATLAIASALKISMSDPETDGIGVIEEFPFAAFEAVKSV